MQPSTHQDLDQTPTRRPVNPFAVALALYVMFWGISFATLPESTVSSFQMAGPLVGVMIVVGWLRYNRFTRRPPAAAPADTQALFATGRSLSDGVLFPPVRLQEGYDMAEVDQFLDRCDAAWLHRDASMTADDVARARFTPVILREGYSMEAVDRHLSRIEQAFRAREAAGH